MKLVVLESPYAGDIEANVLFARRCLHNCLARGESPIASHLLFTQPGVLDDDVPHQRTLGIEAGLSWLRAADYSVYYTDRGWSRGMLEALARCIAFGYDFRIRGLNEPPRQPLVLDLEIEKLLEQRTEK